DHFTAALASADNATSLSDSERFELLAAREAAHDVLGNRNAQAADLEAMTLLARTNPERLIETLTRRARLLARRDRFAEAEAAVREALALAQEQAANQSLTAKAHTALGWVFLARHDPDLAMPHLQTAVNIFPGMAETRITNEARNALALSLQFLSNYSAAREQAEGAFAVYVKWNDSVGQADALVTLGWIAFEQGFIDESKIYYQRALDLSRAVGYRQKEADSLLGLGNVFAWQGLLHDALKSYESALEMFRGMEQRGPEMLARARAVDVWLAVGNSETATQESEMVAAYARESSNRYLEGVASLLLAKSARQHADRKSAQDYLDVALDALDRNSERWAWDRVRIYLELAYLALDKGDPKTVQDYLQTADTICQKSGLHGFNSHVLAARSLALLALKQPEAALAATEQAMSQLPSAGGKAYLIPLAHYHVLTALRQTEASHTALKQAYQLLMNPFEGFAPEQRHQALERIAEHRTIVAVWEALQPRHTTLRLPRVDVPLGRPLRENEWVEVNWTIAEPDDEAISDKVARRRHRLLRLLREAAAQDAAPTHEYLAEALEASVRTISDDIAALRAEHADLPPTRRIGRMPR
ncbi:MAG TPA: tetratricopeptide repeat protein, partial [Anaerolineales bacterium]|nr:tetratricopeptide repeat protein [Anaerolineales bacterium]